MTDLVSLPDIQAQLQSSAETRVRLDEAYHVILQMHDAYEVERTQAAANIAFLNANAVSLSDEVVGLMNQVATLKNQLAIATADVHVTVGTNSVVSRTIPAVSLVESPPIWSTPSWAKAKASLAQCAGAFKTHIAPFGLNFPWKSDANGPMESKPSLWNAPRGLGTQLQRIREIDANAPIIQTLYGAEWFTMELVNPDGSRRPKTFAERFDDSGRVSFQGLPQWLQLVDAAVTLAAGFGCHDIEIWNEAKGYYAQPWDMSMVGQAGKPMGYGYFYAATRAQVEATMTRLGIAPADYRIAAPYFAYSTRGDKTGDALPPGHPLYANAVSAAKYGYINKQAVTATEDFLRNARDNHLPLNAFALDASTYLKSGDYPSVDPFAYLQKFDDLLSWVESTLTTYGFDWQMDKFFSELYPTPPPALQTADSEQLRAALWADTLRICILHGVRYPIMWGPTSPAGGLYHELGGLIDANGALQATGRVFKLFRDSFPAGTKVSPLVCSDSRVDGLCSDVTTVIWSKVNSTLSVDVGGKVVALEGYQVTKVSR